MKKREISAVQQGDRRIEYQPSPPPLRSVRDGMSETGRRWSGYIFGVAIGVAWTAVVTALAFSVGVDRGNEIANDACRAGDVYVDPSVSGSVD